MSQWYYHTGKDQKGPFTSPELREEARAGRLREGDYVWREGMADWAPANKVKGLLTDRDSQPPAFVEAEKPASQTINRLSRPAPRRDPNNPFAAPEVEIADDLIESAAFGRGYASWLSRVGAAIVDGIVTNILAYAAGAVVGIVMSVSLQDEFADPNVQFFGMIAGSLAGFAVSWIYFATFHSSGWQATLGKRASGIFVTDLEGRRISFGRASWRFILTSLLPMFTLGIDYLTPLFTERKQCLHDMIAGTIVLRRR